jgi:hypothetical protein
MLVLAMEFSKIEARLAQMICGRDRQEAGRSAGIISLCNKEQCSL